MKKQKFITTGILAAGALLLAGSVQLQAQTQNYIFNTTTGTQGGQPTQGVPNASTNECDDVTLCIGWDGTVPTWDGTHGDPTGSIYFDGNLTGGNEYGHPIYEGLMIGDQYGEDNYYWPNNGTPINGTLYKALQFDILYDTTSTLTIDQFNTTTNWTYPTELANSWEGQNYIQSQGCYPAIQVGYTPGNGSYSQIGTLTIPDAAASGWQRMTLSYPPSTANINPCLGVWFDKWYNSQWAIAANCSAKWWIANVTLVGSAPPPNPTLTSVTPAVPGLAIFNATEGNSFYDRNEVASTLNSGLSWIGNAGASYSFNLAGYPTTTAAYHGESYMFLVPNPSATQPENAPDWGEQNILILEVQSTSAGTAANSSGQAMITYKVGLSNAEPSTNVVWMGTTNTSVKSAKLLGNYTLTFTGNDAGTLQVPDGTIGTFTVPAGTFDTAFAEGAGANPFSIVLGGQANNADAINQPVTYGSITISGVPSGVAASAVFNANTGTSTNIPANWVATASADPSTVFCVPTDAAYWVDWTSPAVGFGLQDTSAISSPTAWYPVSSFGPLSLFGAYGQLVLTGDLQSPSSTQQYFALLQRDYTALEVALPGQSVSITKQGLVTITGTPTALNGSPWVEGNVSTSVTLTESGSPVATNPGDTYVFAVDAGGYLVTSAVDTVVLSCLTDGGAAGDFVGPTANVKLSSGIAIFTAANSYSWGNDGAATPDTTTPENVQVTDYNNSNIPADRKSVV